MVRKPYFPKWFKPNNKPIPPYKPKKFYKTRLNSPVVEHTIYEGVPINYTEIFNLIKDNPSTYVTFRVEDYFDDYYLKIIFSNEGKDIETPNSLYKEDMFLYKERRKEYEKQRDAYPKYMQKYKNYLRDLSKEKKGK